MRSLLLLSTLTAVLLPCVSAQADEMRTFAFTGTYASFDGFSGGTITGTLSVDTTIGYVMAYDFSVPLVLPNQTLTEKDELNSKQTASLWPGSPTLNEAWRNPNNLMGGETFLGLSLAPTSEGFVDYSGGPVCSASLLCVEGPNNAVETSDVGTAAGYYTQLQAGTFTETADVTGIWPTPEPSSLALLGTGALSLLGVVRRKRVRA